MTDRSEGIELYRVMKERTKFRLLTGCHPEGFRSFTGEQLRKYPAVEIPERKLTVRECELMVMYIAKRSRQPNLDALAHLSWLAFNSLMDYKPDMPLCRNKSKMPRFFHKYSHLTENWLNISGKSKLFPKSLTDKLANMENSGEFDSVRLVCEQPDAPYFWKLANLGAWAFGYLATIAIEKVEAKRKYVDDKRFRERIQGIYFGSCSGIYKYPEIVLREASLPPKGETLYLLLRAAIIYVRSTQKRTRAVGPQTIYLDMLAFHGLSCYGMDIYFQFQGFLHMSKFKLDDVMIGILSSLPKKWAHIGETLELILYYLVACSSLGKYHQFERIFDSDYYRRLGSENNEILMALLVGLSRGNLSPNLEIMTDLGIGPKLVGADLGEARELGVQIACKLQYESYEREFQSMINIFDLISQSRW